MSYAVAREVLDYEYGVIKLLNAVAESADEFEEAAKSIEVPDRAAISDHLAARLGARAVDLVLPDVEDLAPLDGLEIGVAGLAYALSSIWCYTAASCRGHAGGRSWSDCPVVFFASSKWRLQRLAPLIGAEGCGLEADRDMLKVYAPSIHATHRLAQRILAGRAQLSAR